ncbi:Stp1/IreP family PP2C-type Ser/Thr phosphatase [Halalkalibacillus halophilus]|uniref:Stp1/IreP family PP2C-type Ser/Thr phosphatase n=1 Tax=Halalkalibacillus halophilus TaxID=392827 RepID=UPI000415BA0A|nr:Stp1/IreP family PP2C-type Ser/Thr phosphatase [Halalkalibacillus halophilus]
MHAVFRTDQGKVRKANEDYGGVFHNQSNQLLAVVADGMGGHNSGDVASKLAVEGLQQMWENSTSFTDVILAKEWLENAFAKVNETILTYSKNNQECSGMGTTLLAMIVIDRFVVVSHIGDSRLYYITDETIEQITEDHSFVNELVLQGQITKEEAEEHPRKNILTRAIGTDQTIKVDTTTFVWQTGAVCVLCTDGLTNKLSDSDLLSTYQNFETDEEKVQNLLYQANHRGGEDNITVALVNFASEENEGDTL